MSITNDLETPMFEQGRMDRLPVKEEFLDLTSPVNKIRVRIFQERGMHFITGVQLCYVDSDEKSKLLGDLDLHDYGTWTEHRMEEGDQIIGIYGLQNNLIRSIGFIMMNMKPPSGFFESLKQKISCNSNDNSIKAPRPLLSKNEDEPNLGDEFADKI